jgi:hypothetical protein
MKKNTKRIVCFVLVFLILLQGIITFLKIADTNTLISMKGLSYEKENDHDVIFLGQSDVYTGYIPTQAWKEYGYSSFAYGLSAMPATMFPSALDEISINQHPKVLVVEITAFAKKDKYYNRSAETHSWIDNLPMGKNRLKTIFTAIPKEKRKEYFSPVSTYHNNWKLPRICARTAFVRVMNTFHRESILKGFSVTADTNKKKHKKYREFTFTKKDETYLKEFMEHCKELDYENVLFVSFPHVEKIKNEKAIEQIEHTVTEAGYDFLNLNSELELLDLDEKNDFYSDEHLNLYGAQKLTSYLGEYLTQHYDLTPRRDADFVKRWDENSQKADEILEYGREQMEKKSRKRIYEYSLQAEKLSSLVPFLADNKKK